MTRTGTLERCARACTARPRPDWVSTAGWMPRASSRSSVSASVSSAIAVSIAWAASLSCLASSRTFASRRASIRFSIRCWAPSWRLRSTRRRSAPDAATMRALDALISSRWARACACRRSFSIASPAAAATADTRPGWSARTGSWISAAIGSPSRASIVTARPPSSLGASTVTPDSSTNTSRSGNQYATSIDGSCRARAKAPRIRPGGSGPSNSTTRSATADRSRCALARPTTSPTGHSTNTPVTAQENSVDTGSGTPNMTLRRWMARTARIVVAPHSAGAKRRRPAGVAACHRCAITTKAAAVTTTMSA